MRQDFFTYTPQFTLLVVGNHRPSLRAVDAAIARRMHLIPFTQVIPDARQDRELVARLVADEGAAILRWMIAGHLAWRVAGRLVRPDFVQAATDAYLRDEDHVGLWLGECTEASAPDSRCPMRDLYASWRDWCARNGVDRPGAQKILTSALKDRGHAVTPHEGYPHLRGRVLSDREVARLEAARADRAEAVRTVGRVLAVGAERVAAEPDAGAVEQDEKLPF